MVSRDLLSEQSVIGWILLGENRDFFSDKKHGFIYELYVLPLHRGKGISKLLINEAMNTFRVNGYDEIRLNVFERNYAKDIYKKLGFESVNTIMAKSLTT